MPETIKSVIESELGRFSQMNRQILNQAGVTSEVINTINTTGDVLRALTLPGESTLSSLDLNREVPEEHINRVRDVINEAINTAANRTLVG